MPDINKEQAHVPFKIKHKFSYHFENMLGEPDDVGG